MFSFLKPKKQQVQVRASASDLLKCATIEKKNGDIDSAIETLRLANRAMSEDDRGYNITSYLRLPSYLQAAGRTDEAWQELNKLLLTGTGQKPFDKKLWKSAECSERSIVHDKIRLFLQRERRCDDAIAHGVLSKLYQLLMLAYDPYTKQSIDRDGFAEEIRTTLQPLLKKARRKIPDARLEEIILTNIINFPDIEFKILHESIDLHLNIECK